MVKVNVKNLKKELSSTSIEWRNLISNSFSSFLFDCSTIPNPFVTNFLLAANVLEEESEDKKVDLKDWKILNESKVLVKKVMKAKK